MIHPPSKRPLVLLAAAALAAFLVTALTCCRARAEGLGRPGAARPTGALDLGRPRAACADALEPNDRQDDAPPLPRSRPLALSICPGDRDFIALPAGGALTVRFAHGGGDLDLVALAADGTEVDRSDGDGDAETVVVPAGGAVLVYGFRGADNAYVVESG